MLKTNKFAQVRVSGFRWNRAPVNYSRPTKKVRDLREFSPKLSATYIHRCVSLLPLISYQFQNDPFRETREIAKKTCFYPVPQGFHHTCQNTGLLEIEKFHFPENAWTDRHENLHTFFIDLNTTDIVINVFLMNVIFE